MIHIDSNLYRIKKQLAKYVDALHTRGQEIPTAALDFWLLGPYGGITVLRDSDTLVMVCPINAIVVLFKPEVGKYLPPPLISGF